MSSGPATALPPRAAGKSDATEIGASGLPSWRESARPASWRGPRCRVRSIWRRIFRAASLATTSSWVSRSSRRQRPLYEQPGIHAGSFLIKPSLDEATGYDSNPIGVTSAPGSWLLKTSPSVTANSEWSRNSLGVSLSADNYQYWNAPNDNYTNWTAAIGGGYTIGRNDLTLAYSHLSLNQSPGDIGAVPSDTFVHYQVDDIRSAYTFDLGRISFTPNIDARHYYFDNTTIQGVPTSQQYRNRYVLSEGVTTRYALSRTAQSAVRCPGRPFTLHRHTGRDADNQLERCDRAGRIGLRGDGRVAIPGSRRHPVPRVRIIGIQVGNSTDRGSERDLDADRPHHRYGPPGALHRRCLDRRHRRLHLHYRPADRGPRIPAQRAAAGSGGSAACAVYAEWQRHADQFLGRRWCELVDEPQYAFVRRL